MIFKRKHAHQERFSPEKIVKSLADQIHAGTAPLNTVVQNQGIIIGQNKQIVELLQRIYNSLDKQ
jgi:hypothetical protein